MVNGLSGGDEPSQQHFHHHHEAESDADEEVRSLDLPGKQITRMNPDCFKQQNYCYH